MTVEITDTVNVRHSPKQHTSDRTAFGWKERPDFGLQPTAADGIMSRRG